MSAMVTPVDAALGAALNEQELWREMVRWSGGRIVEHQGVLLVSGPSAYLRVAIRTDPRIDGSAVVTRATRFFADGSAGFLVLVRRPDDEGIERAAVAQGFRPGWTERSMVLTVAPSLHAVPDDVDVRLVADERAVVDYGRVVALANDDPGERERAPLLFHEPNDRRSPHRRVRGVRRRRAGCLRHDARQPPRRRRVLRRDGRARAPAWSR
jgi:hypothetical protein